MASFLLLPLALAVPHANLVVPVAQQPITIMAIAQQNELMLPQLAASPATPTPPAPPVPTAQPTQPAPVPPPAPQTPQTPIPAPPVTFATLPSPWGCISYYESTNNLTAVNPASGTEGAFQFNPTTWAEFAPAGFPSSPLYASLGQQLTVAQIVQQNQGWGAWTTAGLCGQ